jgi:hypothetical protein
VNGTTRHGDLRWWGAVFGTVVVAAALLYAAAFHLPSPGRVFMGFLLNSGDAWGYRAFVEAFARGGWLIDNPLSDAFERPAFFNLLWFCLGKIRGLTGMPFLPVFYLFGIAAAGVMFWVILRFCREFAGDGAAGRFAFLLASFGGGLGWITLLVSDDTVHRFSPMDLYYPEGFPLQAALFAPHLALSIALVGTIMLWFWRGVSTGRRAWVCGAAGLALCLSFFHPYHLATVGLVAGAWVALEQLLDRRRLHQGWLGLALLGLAVLPAVLYYRWFFRQPNWSLWASENIVRTWGAVPILLGLGPAILLAAAGAWRSGRFDPRRRFLATWAVVGIALLNSFPLFRFEAKLIEGLILPLAALGAGAFFGNGVAGSRRGWLAAAGVLLLLLPSHALLAAESLDTVRRRDTYFPPNWGLGATCSEGELEAIRFLGGLDPRQTVFAPPEFGFMIPGLAGLRPFIGSIDISPRFTQKFHIGQAVYFQPIASYERYQLLVESNVDLLWLPVRNGYLLDPSREPYLERVFANADVHLYAVRR